MPTPNQQADVANAITEIRNAQSVLTAQIHSATDSLTAMKLMQEYNKLDSYLTQIIHAQNAADDTIFTTAVKSLQSQVAGLKSEETTIQKIVTDVGTAAQIVGYITQAIGFIVAL